MFVTRTQAGFAKLPDSEVESEDRDSEGRGGVNKERKRERKRKSVRRKGSVSRKKRGEGRGKTTKGEKKKTGLVNDTAMGKDVDNRVMMVKTKKARGNEVNGNAKLMAHATRGGKGVVDQTEVVENKGGGSRTRGSRERLRDRVNARVGRWTRYRGLVGGEERRDFLATMSEGDREVMVTDKGMVDGGASGFGDMDKGKIRSREMTLSPEVDGSSIAMLGDELACFEANFGKQVVFEFGVKKRRPRGEERDIESPEVLERGTRGEQTIEGDQGLIGVGAPVKRGDKLANQLFQGGVKLTRKNEEKKMVREERDDKGVNE